MKSEAIHETGLLGNVVASLFPLIIYIYIYIYIYTLSAPLGQVDEWAEKPSRFSIHGRLSEFFRIMAAKTLQNVIRITYRQRRSNFSRRDRKPILEKKNRKLYKKWLITRNYVSLNKYKLYCNKIAIINRIYRDWHLFIDQ